MTTQGQPIFWPEGGPTAIRDATVSTLQATGYFKNVFRNKTTPTKDDHLPCAAVWLVRDDTEPMGDANLGTPSFDHKLTICVDVLMSAASDDALTAVLDDLALKTRTALMCDNAWRQTFEGIERCSIHPVYPKDTNLIFVQAAIEVVVTFRSAWPPYLPNDLTEINVTVQPTQRWTCSVCAAENPPASTCCPLCGTPAPQPTAPNTFVNVFQPQGSGPC